MANSVSRRFFRRFHMLALISLCVFSMAACSQQSGDTLTQGKTMTDSKDDVVYMDVALFSYLDRPIFDVYLNGVDIGVAAGQPHRGEANGLMTGVPIHLGPQTITWRSAETGSTTSATNRPILIKPNPEFHYLGVHIYPDNAVEVIPEKYWPEKTKKGEEINREWELEHGQ